MAATDNFRKQHVELVEIVGKNKPMLVPATLAANPAAVRPLLAMLIGKLNMHLAMEDEALYPRLKNHANAELRALAGRFMDEMSSIKPLVVEYARKWTNAAIAGDAAKFCEETRGIFAALAGRIDRENNELYALADRLG